MENIGNCLISLMLDKWGAFSPATQYRETKMYYCAQELLNTTKKVGGFSKAYIKTYFIPYMPLSSISDTYFRPKIHYHFSTVKIFFCHHVTYITISHYLGRDVIFPHFSIQKRLSPLLPRRAANPSYGTLDVPVTNCKSRNLCSLLNLSTAAQNHRMTM